MIEEIRVDGFRSLINFQLKFAVGLNVLVGPNGTGKSNFISFLDFMSAFFERDLNNAIGVAQGAGSVFSKEKFSEDEATLEFSVIGSWQRGVDDDDLLPSASSDTSASGAYKYSCVIKYLRAVPAVYIACEKISSHNSSGAVIELERRTLRDGRVFKSEILVSENSRTSLKPFFRYMRLDQNKTSVEGYISSRISPERSFLPLLAGEELGLSYTYLDLVSYRSVNIDPVIARRPTPVGSTSELEPTGEGLAGALYQLKRGGVVSTRNRWFRYLPRNNDRKISFESILSWCREVNPSISQVDVHLDFTEAQLRPSMYFDFGGVKESFPFARISDGTVKWLALVTILLAEPRLNIIEEPENFLHPFMQESFISLCRQIIEREPQRTIIISTHSPALLDYCGANELTMFELQNGQTRGERVANWDELNKKIERSRFGLGHYYRTGALYGENSRAG